MFNGEGFWSDTVAAIGVVWTRETLWIFRRTAGNNYNVSAINFVTNMATAALISTNCE